MTLLSFWSLKELCISSMTPPLCPRAHWRTILGTLGSCTYQSPLRLVCGTCWPLLGTCCCCGNVNVAKQTAETLQQASYRRRRVWRRRGWEALDDSCKVVHKSCADLFKSSSGSTRGRQVDMQCIHVIRGTCVFSPQREAGSSGFAALWAPKVEKCCFQCF